MRADFESFLNRYGWPTPPESVWQVPLDGDAEPYARLLAQDPALPESDALPSAYDFGCYCDDICYQPEVQGDIFAALLPLCLALWHRDQMSESPADDYTGAVEIFIAALARRPLLQDHVTRAQAKALEAFMGNTLLDRIDALDSLACPDKRSLVFPWILALGSHAVLFSNLEHLWRDWWRFETPGQAIATLQYLSCLLYDDCANPLLVSTGPKIYRLVPPPLWDNDGQIFDQAWRTENVIFLMEFLTVDRARAMLEQAKAILDGVLDSAMPARLLADFEAQRPLLEHRLKALPEILMLPADGQEKWPVFPQ